MSKKLFVRGAATTLLMLFGLALKAQTFYVATYGNDQAIGSREEPLASIAEARDRVRILRSQKLLSDTVFVNIAPGTYHIDEPIHFGEQDSGTAESPTIYRAADEERPVLSGGLETGAFEMVKTDLWRVYIPESRRGLTFEQIYINGERRFLAQTPNRGEFFRFENMERRVIDGTDENPIFSISRFGPKKEDGHFLRDIGQAERDRVKVTFYHKWETVSKPIDHIEKGGEAFFVSGRRMRHAVKESDYYISNYRAALDAPGEWFLEQDGWLYYIPMEGETIESVSCTIPVAEQFLTIEGTVDRAVKHIGFENIRFHTAGYRSPARGYDSPQAACYIEATVMLDNVENISFVGCDIAHTGLHAIWFRNNCYNSIVERCHLYDLGGGGIKIGTLSIPQDENFLTRGITIHNNIIQHGGYVFPSAVGVIIFHGSDNEITHNDIANFRYTGVSCGWIWGYHHSPSLRNKIEFNHIHHLGWGELSDMGGVYTLGNSEGSSVSNNVIHHVFSRGYGGWGIYTDEGTANILIENNLVYDCKSGGFHQHYGRDNIVRNNIFALNRKSGIEVSSVEEHLSYSFKNNIVVQDGGEIISDVWGMDNGTKIVVDYDYNCYWNIDGSAVQFYGLSLKKWREMGRDKHSVIADPKFVDAKGLDFRFRNRSVAKKIGFKPFDYSRAGVYGDEAWREKAEISLELEQEFERSISKIEDL